jgi:hypothetical protein
MFRTTQSLVLLAAFCGYTAASAWTNVQVRHLATDRTTAPNNGDEFLLVQSPSEFSKALNQKLSHVSAQKPEDVVKGVDFKAETVVGVMLSGRPTSCTGVEIQAIKQDGNEVVVQYLERLAQKDEVCLETIYSPFDFVAIPKTKAHVTFKDMTAR